MNFVQLLKRVSHTVNNDVVKPIDRLVNPKQQPKPGFTPAPVQHLDFKNPHWQMGLQPQQNELAGQDIFNKAKQNLQFTPAFGENVSNAKPYVGSPLATGNLADPKAASAEYLGNYIPNSIVIGQKFGSPDKINNQQILLHEGLHRVWDTNPKVRKEFAKVYNDAAAKNPELTKYLQMRVSGYASARKLLDEGGVYKNDFKKLESLPPDLQNEIHSYLPQGFFSEKELGSGLTKYYQKYYSPQAAKDYASTTEAMFGALYGYDTGAAQRDPRTEIFNFMNQQLAKKRK